MADAAASFADLVDMEATGERTQSKSPREIVIGGSQYQDSRTFVGKINNFGLVSLSAKDKQQLPRKLSGMFTNIASATQAVEAWLAENPLRQGKTEEKVERPEVKAAKSFEELVKE